MACLLTDGRALGCRDNTGGVKRVFIANYDPAETYTIVAGVITVITTTEDYFTFEQDIEVGSFNGAGQFSTENGTSFYELTVEITLSKMDTPMRDQLQILGQGAWKLIVLDNNGRYWLIGKENPVRVSASTAGTGKAFGDLNGSVITFMGKEPAPAYEVGATAAGTVIVPN